MGLLLKQRVSLRIFLPLALALAMNVVIWSAVFRFTSWPGVIMWPNQLITELLIPWLVGITSTTQTRMGHIHEIVVNGVWIVGFIYLMRFLRYLGVPTLQEALALLQTWGVVGCGQAFIILAVSWRAVVYMFPLVRPLFLLPGEHKYCRGPEFITLGLDYPPCPTTKLGDMTEQIELPWTQDSLVQSYFATMEQIPDSWKWYYDIILAVILGIFHLAVFRLGGYAVTRFPSEISTYFIFREPQFLAFLSYQILRFLASLLPRFVFSFPLRLIRIMQLPFRKALANQGWNARIVCSAFPWLVLTIIVEIYLTIEFLTPRSEWELQYSVLLFKIKVMFVWALLSMFGFLVWNREWTRNVTFPDDPDVIESQMFRGPIPDFFYSLLCYWDGFWRYDESNRRGKQGIGQTEYIKAFNASDVLCKGLGYFAHCLFLYYYITQVDEIIRGTGEGYRQLLWAFVVPTSVSMILDENFFNGKRDRHTFRYLLSDDDQTF